MLAGRNQLRGADGPAPAVPCMPSSGEDPGLWLPCHPELFPTSCSTGRDGESQEPWVQLWLVSLSREMYCGLTSAQVYQLDPEQESPFPGGSAEVTGAWQWCSSFVLAVVMVWDMRSLHAVRQTIVLYSKKWVGTRPAVSLDLFRLMSDGEDDE